MYKILVSLEEKQGFFSKIPMWAIISKEQIGIAFLTYLEGERKIKNKGLDFARVFLGKKQVSEVVEMLDAEENFAFVYVEKNKGWEITINFSLNPNWEKVLNVYEIKEKDEREILEKIAFSNDKKMK